MGNLYDVFLKDRTQIMYSATTKDIKEELGCRREEVYNAVNCGYVMRKKYFVELADRTLTKTRDEGLLIEFDMARQEILKAGRREG